MNVGRRRQTGDKALRRALGMERRHVVHRHIRAEERADAIAKPGADECRIADLRWNCRRAAERANGRVRAGVPDRDLVAHGSAEIAAHIDPVRNPPEEIARRAVCCLCGDRVHRPEAPAQPGRERMHGDVIGLCRSDREAADAGRGSNRARRGRPDIEEAIGQIEAEMGGDRIGDACAEGPGEIGFR